MSLRTCIQQSLAEVQQKTADWLGQKLNRYTTRQKKTALIVLMCAIGTFCLMLIIGITGTEGSGNTLRVDSISFPKGTHPFTLDSLRALPPKILDSLQSIIKELYRDKLN